jgi:hypothetical protein
MTKSSSPRHVLDTNAILGVQEALNSALRAFHEAGEQLDVDIERLQTNGDHGVRERILHQMEHATTACENWLIQARRLMKLLPPSPVKAG